MDTFSLMSALFQQFWTQNGKSWSKNEVIWIVQ